MTSPTSQLIAKDVCAWPNLFRLDDNTIAAVIFNRPSHGLLEGSLDLYHYDIHRNTWGYRSTPAPSLPGQNRMHSSCGVGRDTTLHVLSTGFSISNGTFKCLEPLWHSVSRDAGTTWNIEENIAIADIDSHCIPHGSIVFFPDGMLMTSVYRSYGKNNPSKTWAISSDDNGNTWRMRGLIGEGDTNEAHILLSGDTLFAAVRTHRDHHTRLYTSMTRGREWSDCGSLTLPMQHPGHLLAIEDKVLLLTYGIRNKGLMGIGGRFSFDAGKTWDAPFLLLRFPDETRDCGYPSTAMLDDDRLITGYYTDLSTEYEGYQFGACHWNLSDFLSKKILKTISDGRNMTI